MNWVQIRFIFFFSTFILLPLLFQNCAPSKKQQQDDTVSSSSTGTPSGGNNTPAPAGSPKAPSNLLATSASSVQVNLNWIDNSNNETYFKIERAPNAGGPFAGADGPGEFSVINMTNSNTASYIDSNLQPNTTYYYRVSASNNSGSSAPTSVVKIVTQVAPSNPPSAPSNQAGVAQAATIIRLTWTDTSNNETAFVVERSVNNGGTFTAVGGGSAGANNFQDINLLPATTYVYRIKAINGVGSSSYTPNVSVTTLAAGDKTTFTYIRVNIIEPNCVGCHGAAYAAQGIRYDTYQAVSSGANTMIGSINAGRMPPGNTLTIDQKNSISSWISKGTPNN